MELGDSSKSDDELNSLIWSHFCDAHTEDMDALDVFASSINVEEG